MPEDKDQARQRLILARAEALNHPLRIAICDVLIQRYASASELAEELGEPVERIRHQLRQLRKAGLVAVTEERRRRGVIERFYIGKDDAMAFYPEEYASLAPEMRRRLAAAFLKLTFRESLNALSRRTLIAREDGVLARTPLQVDEQGWSELAAIHREAFERVQAVKAASAKRIDDGEELPISVSSMQLLFETPGVSGPPLPAS